MRSVGRIAALVTAIGIGIPGIALCKQHGEPFRGETTVNVIEVPVEAVNRETGAAAVGLTADDFEIRENGKLQAITNFAELWRSEADAAAIGDLDPAAVDRTINDLRTRTVEMVYLFDLYLMNREGRNRAIEGLRATYREGVPEGQNVSVVAYNGSLEVFVDRTDDNAEVLDALTELGEVRTRGNEQSVAFSEELIDNQVTGERDHAFYERRRRNREFIDELQKRVLRVGDAALATMARYAAADGRRVLVVFTPGQPRTEWVPEYASVDYVNSSIEYPTHDLWRDVALEAADLGFTLYAIDSSGIRVSFDSDVETGITDYVGDAIDRGPLVILGGEATIEPASAVDENYTIDPEGETHNLGSWLERTRKAMLGLAAGATGGEAIFTRDVAKAIDRVETSVGHYYSLAYVADHVGDGQTYSIEVRLPNHPELRLTHRTAYVDQPAALRSGRQLRSAMLFGADANPLGIRVDVGETDSRFRLGAAGSKRVTVPLKVKIPYGRLEMVRRGDIYWAKVWITLFAEDAAGNQSQLASHEQPITVPSDRYQEAVARGYFSYNTGVEIEGGSQKVYVGIQEELSGRTSIMPLELKH